MTRDIGLRRPELEAASEIKQEAQNYGSGNWVVQQGREAEFVARWNKFLGWTRAQMPGLRWAMLIKDADDRRHFISLAGWESLEALLAWRSLPEFAEKLGACRALCDEFRGSNYQLIATA